MAASEVNPEISVRFAETLDRHQTIPVAGVDLLLVVIVVVLEHFHSPKSLKMAM